MTQGIKTTASAIVIMLVTFVAYIIFQKTRLIKALSFDITKLDLDGNFLEPSIFITVKITNTSYNSANIQNISGSVFSASGQKVAAITLQDQTIIFPNTFVNLKLKIDPVMDNFVDLVNLSLNDPNTKFIFSGYVTADGVPLPLRLTYTVKDLMHA